MPVMIANQEPFPTDAAVCKPLVLCVDDDPICRALLEAILSGAGLQIIVCDSGRSALVAGQRNAFTLAVLDYDMPDMTGVAVAVALRRLRPKIRIVLHTANPDRPPSDLLHFDACCRKANDGVNLVRILYEFVNAAGGSERFEAS